MVLDGKPTGTFIEAIDKLKQVDSIFVFAPSDETIAVLNEKQHGFLVNLCENEDALTMTIQRSSVELDKQNNAFSIYNKKEKATRDLSKEAGSFLFFQLIKTVIKNIPKTEESKATMVATCRNYYRGNKTELSNIDDFDRTYKSADAIPWYTKETFVYK